MMLESMMLEGKGMSLETLTLEVTTLETMTVNSMTLESMISLEAMMLEAMLLEAMSLEAMLLEISQLCGQFRLLEPISVIYKIGTSIVKEVKSVIHKQFWFQLGASLLICEVVSGQWDSASNIVKIMSTELDVALEVDLVDYSLEDLAIAKHPEADWQHDVGDIATDFQA